MVMVLSILFCFLSIIFVVIAGGGGCSIEETGTSQADCQRYLSLSGLTTENNPDNISFDDHLVCIRVLNLNCKAVLRFATTREENMIQIIVDYNSMSYYVNTYLEDAREHLDYVDGGEDDDEDSDEEEDKW